MWANQWLIDSYWYAGRSYSAKTYCIVINNVLSIVINIQNTTIYEPVILTGFYSSILRNSTAYYVFQRPRYPVFL